MKSYVEIEIDVGKKVLIESTPETRSLIEKMSRLEASIGNLVTLLKKNKFGGKKLLEETHKLREDLQKKIDDASSEMIVVKNKLKDKIYNSGEEEKFRYDVRLDSEEGILLGNLLMANISDVRYKVTPKEGHYREELLEKIHPANHRNKIQEKKESLIRIEVGEGPIGHDKISHLSSLDEVTFVTDKATYKISSCPGCFSLTLDRKEMMDKD